MIYDLTKPQHSGYRQNISQHNKSRICQTHSYHHTQMKVFPLRSGTRQGCPVSLLFFDIKLKVLATAIRQEKERKWIQIGNKEVKLLLLADDMILYMENLKDATKKLLEVINEISKILGYNINIQKSVIFYILTANYQKEKLRKQSYLQFTSKGIKLNRNKSKEMKHLYSEN